MEEKLQQLIEMLDDPEISETVKDTVRASIRELNSGGFKAALEKNSVYLARNDLDVFAEVVFGVVPATHHKEMTRVLMDDSIKNVLIVAPPGHAKSTYVSQVFPAWYMGKHPNRAIQLISSSSSQSSKLSSSVRSVVGNSPEYKKVFPELEPDDADGGMGWTRDMLYIRNRTPGNKDPNLLAAGVDSTTVLGSRSDLTIVDDPTTQQQAASPGELIKQKEWFRDTLLTRLRPGGRMVVVLTRWHENDLAAMLVRDLGFTVIHMPAMGEDEEGANIDFIPGMRIDSAKGWDMDNLPENIQFELEEYYARATAEGFRAEITKSVAYNRPCVRKWLHPDRDKALWPGEHDIEALEYYQEVRLGPIRFRLVYQGDPTGVTGDIFKREWFRYYGEGQEKTRIPEDATYFQSVDVATSTKARSDFFVIATVALDREGNYYVVNIVREKLMAPEQRELVKQNYLHHPKTVWVLIETVAYQLALFQELSKMNVPCRTYRPRNKKEDRAISASAVFSARRVYLPVEAEWLNEFRDEFTSFPRGRHDDQIDAISSLFEELATNWNPFPKAMDIGFGMDEDDEIDVDVFF
jgi:predicted phage terminase large subunit-like protein